MIDVLPGFPNAVVAFAGHGRVTRADYRTVLEPVVEAALREQRKLRVYYEVGADFAGMDAGAVWEDFRVGIGHIARWERIAVVADNPWIRRTARIVGAVMPADLRVFSTSERANARDWISAP
jgi:hypothetical protein